MDELDAIQEELEAARTEAERLAERLADREARAAELEQATAGLRRDLETAHGERRAALARYRETLLAQSPELPADLITGDTLEAVDRSAGAARELVARVREQVASADAARPVPTGSPPRRGPDTSAMSPAEKIRYGLSEQT